ncbi:hypothetical protein C8R42DRAFT_728523 [Lentinula raphanica]|nr:hypothetical protein C8R42DRAFT_728523 [Lentinula raphanica]
MRPLVPSVFSLRPFSVPCFACFAVCLLGSIQAGMARSDSPMDQQHEDSIPNLTLHPILLSRVLDKDGKDTKSVFLNISNECLCKDDALTLSMRPLPFDVSTPAQTIGYVYLVEGQEAETLTQARTYAGGVRYPEPVWDSLNYLTFLDNVMEYLHEVDPVAVIDDYSMKSWKEELKRLKALDGKKIILNEYRKFTHPTGNVSIQIGDDVLSLTALPKLPKHTDSKEWIKGVIFGPIEEHVQLDLDELCEHAKLHSEFCGTEEEAQKLKMKEEEWRESFGTKTLANWKYVDGVMDGLVERGHVSKEISEQWDKLCPARMTAYIHHVEHGRRKERAPRNSKRIRYDASQREDPAFAAKKQRTTR